MPSLANEFRKIAVHQVRGEVVVAGGDRRVGRENQGRRCQFAGFRIREGPCFHVIPDELEGQECGVSFVHVIHGRMNAQGVEHSAAADAQKNLLANAIFEVPAVELIGDVAVFAAGVFGNVGVQQIEGNAACLDAPDLGEDLVVRIVDFDGQRFPVRPAHERRRDGMEVVVFVGFLLPACGIQVLAEVALLIEQADADQGHAQIAGGFQVVSGKDAEAAGEYGDAFGQAEFRGEIGDDRILRAAVSFAEPRGFALHVAVKIFEHSFEVSDEGFVGGGVFQALLVDGPQHAHGIVAACFPEVAVEPSEQRDRVVVPGPAQVVGQVAQAFEGRRKFWDDCESVSWCDGHCRLLMERVLLNAKRLLDVPTALCKDHIAIPVHGYILFEMHYRTVRNEWSIILAEMMVFLFARDSKSLAKAAKCYLTLCFYPFLSRLTNNYMVKRNCFLIIKNTLKLIVKNLS